MLKSLLDDYPRQYIDLNVREEFAHETNGKTSPPLLFASMPRDRRLTEQEYCRLVCASSHGGEEKAIFVRYCLC